MSDKFIFSASKLPTANDLGDGFMRRIKRSWNKIYVDAVLNFNKIENIDKFDKCLSDPKTKKLRELLNDMRNGNSVRIFNYYL